MEVSTFRELNNEVATWSQHQKFTKNAMTRSLQYISGDDSMGEDFYSSQSSYIQPHGKIDYEGDIKPPNTNDILSDNPKFLNIDFLVRPINFSGN